MLQLQYLNRGLKNKHINHILDNYKIKYSGIKMEIESKVNDMIDLVLKDILGFLENVEETAKKKKKDLNCRNTCCNKYNVCYNCCSIVSCRNNQNSDYNCSPT